MQRAAGGFKLGVKKNIEVKIFILLYFHKIQQGLRIFFVILGRVLLQCGVWGPMWRDRLGGGYGSVESCGLRAVSEAVSQVSRLLAVEALRRLFAVENTT